MGGLRFSADGDADSVNDDYMARWLTFGPVGLKVVRGHLPDGTTYLNLFFKNMKNAGYPLGGLLGEDDHQQEATPSAHCKIPTINLRLNLHEKRGNAAADDMFGKLSSVA